MFAAETDVKLTILPLFSALFALFFVALSLNVIRLRHRHKVELGTGHNQSLERAMRVHANFAEYVPLSLLLILTLEINQANPAILAGLCLALLLGRLIHAFGVSREKEQLVYRVTGMILTFGVLLSAAFANILSVI